MPFPLMKCGPQGRGPQAARMPSLTKAEYNLRRADPRSQNESMRT
jgi:hypothetical protein